MVDRAYKGVAITVIIRASSAVQLSFPKFLITVDLTPLLKRLPRSSIQSVTEATDDLYGVASVSSFYDPGAWLGIRDCAARIAIEYFASCTNHAKTVCMYISFSDDQAIRLPGLN